jgi:hypothetical protein
LQSVGVVIVRRVVAATLGVLVSGAAAGVATAARPVLIDRPGTWSLTRLGYGTIVLRENEATARTFASVRYRLPAGAVETQSRWYLFHLHYVVALRPDASAGEFNVAAATDGRYTASTIFTVRRRNGKLESTADDVGMVAGHVRRTSSALVREMRFDNFLAFGGVRPGLNELRFELTSNAVPMVRWVRILPDSAIVLTQRGPPAIGVELRAEGRRLRVGEASALEFVVRHLRGQPVAAAKISLGYPVSALRVSPTAKTLRWGSLEPLHGRFLLTPTRAGNVTVSIEATAALAKSRATTVLAIAPAAGSATHSWIWIVVIAVAAGAALAVVVLRARLRRSRS